MSNGTTGAAAPTRTRADKRRVVEELLRQHPDLSDRAIGEKAGADHKTVGKIRREMGGEIGGGSSLGGCGEIRDERFLLWGIKPSPENDKLYDPIDPNGPDVVQLAESIRDFGLKDPIRITSDAYILSGHRRYTACRRLGLKHVPVVVDPVARVVGHGPCGEEIIGDEFMQLLKECNRQRVKSVGELAREELLSVNPHDAYQVLIDYRRAAAAAVDVDQIELGAVKRRDRISAAKRPFLDAVLAALLERKRFWPLTVRQVHYALLNAPPLKNADKPDSTYANDLRSYKNLCDLLVRARLEGSVPWGCIHDPTRPRIRWNWHRNTQSFLRREMDGFLKGYQRDLLQSQPNMVIVVAEKNAVDNIVQPVCSDYGLPMDIMRGYCSSDPREKLREFEASGKEKLILLMLTDFDPEGENIASSYAESMRDDFKVSSVVAKKVALTADQVAAMNLHPQPVKKKSSRAKGFIEKHGNDVYELDAIPPDELQNLLKAAIESVLDLDAFNREVGIEKQEAVQLEAIRRRISSKVFDMIG